MFDLKSLRPWLLILALAGGCSSGSPLIWSAADELDDDDGKDGDKPVEEQPPPVVARDAGNTDLGMDSGVVVVAKKPPCGTGPGCDPTDLGGESCESLGAGGGKLLCDSTTCLFELGLCDGLPRDAAVGRPCGTGPGCNIQDLGGETCGSLGMQSGALGCDPETCQFDTSLCGPGGGLGGVGATFGGGTTSGGMSGTGGVTGGGTGGTGFFGGNFFGGNFFGGNNDDEDGGV